VKPAPFAYERARSVEHAIALARGHDGEARFLAGGQSLVASLNLRLSRPSLLIDLNGIVGLDRIARRNGHIELGALVRHAAAERAPEIATGAPLLALALPHIGHPAIRNRGTIGGSIALADPAAELPACLVALEGEVEIAGAAGRRAVKAEDFFKGLFATDLGPHDILTAIRVPAAPGMRFAFAELARRHGDYAIAGLAAAARAEGGALAEVRLVFFGLGVMPVRARRAETALAAGDVEAAVAALAEDLDPPADLQASATVKRHLAGVLLRRAARQLAEPRL
jgi:carbon-monoxide dehydrogenase medium subunit